MATRSDTVNTELQLRLVVPGTPSLPVRAGLRYDMADPYAVQVAFYTGAGNGDDVVEWTFARELLGDGMTRAAGEGDVQVWPSLDAGDAALCLSLCSPSGRALFEVPRPALSDFLSRTYSAVPAGRESDHVDVDAELELLLWAEPET